jgi:hypothetical protein
MVHVALQTPTIFQPFPNAGHPFAPRMNPMPWDSSEEFLSDNISPVLGVQQSSSEITSADEGKILPTRADFSTNLYIPDDNMNGHEDGPNGITDTMGTADTADAADAADAADTADTADAADTADTADAADATDSLDADVLEILTDGPTTFTVPEVVPPSELLEAVQPPPDPLIQTEAANSETVPESTVTRFPFGSPGAPIPSPDQGPTVYQSSQAALGSSIWAPFCSRIDWEIARWAKMRGPTSSAVTELLAIPEVRHPHLALTAH